MARYFTFVSPEFVRKLYREGFINGLRKREMLVKSPYYGEWEMESCYDWMKEQVDKRVEATNYYPIWLYKGKVPDHFLEDGEEQHPHPEEDTDLILEVELSPDRVLDSSFDAWHIPMNDWAITTETEEVWENNLTPQGKIATWERIFDIDWCIEHDYMSWCGDGTDVQGCTPRLYWKEVKSVQSYAYLYHKFKQGKVKVEKYDRERV